MRALGQLERLERGQRARERGRGRESAHLDEVEQLEDDGRDAPEEAGPALALHDGVEPLDLDERADLLAHVGRDPARVQGVDGREEQGRDVEEREGGDVGRERARVRRQVLGRRELSRVDKDRDDRVSVGRERGFDCARARERGQRRGRG